MDKLLIKNARVIDPASSYDATGDIAIENGLIVSVGKAPAGFTPGRTVDATGLCAMPGLVDLSARLREPGYEHKATLTSEMNAAVAGGVTSLVCTPDTDPALDEPGLVEMLKYRAAALNLAHVYPLGAITAGLKGEQLTEMMELSDAGCIGFAHANEKIPNTQVLYRVMQYANSFGYTCWLAPQDPHLSSGCAHAGHVAVGFGLPGIPVSAETISLFTIFELMKTTGAKVHLCRLSSRAGIELVRKAKKEGLPLTCDVGVHHLLLTEEDIGFFDTNARLTPPLRSVDDRDAITEAVLDGTIDAVCSDHTPADDDEKLLPFAQAEPGATGLELLLSLSVEWAKKQGTPDALMTALGKITSGPAAIIGQPCGSLAAGMPADICLFDINAQRTITADSLVSQGRHTPFLGKTVSADVIETFIGGRSVYRKA